MRIRMMLGGIVMAVVALGGEGFAVAQSAPAAAPAPAHVCTASDASLACMVQWTPSVGPELAAARASLGAAAKTGGTGGAIDFNSLANRQAAAGNTGASALSMPSGAGAAIQAKAGAEGSLQVLHGGVTGATSAAPVIPVVPVGDVQDGWAAASAPSPLAATVLRGQVNPAARSCYENDPDAKSRRPGRLILLIKLTPTGDIDSVTVANNVGVSPSVTSCITTVAGAAKFAPPGRNAATVHATFTFPPQEEPASSAAAPPAAAHAAGTPAVAAPESPRHAT
jgi:hypothetical protein